MTNIQRGNFQAHPFHLVSPSPWPILTTCSLLILAYTGLLSMHSFIGAKYLVLVGFLLVISSMSFWFRDIISEGTYLGDHTSAVQKGLNIGVGFFIISEALFFLSIFWAFFHAALAPPMEVGAHWPPEGIESVNAFELPLVNTIILLSSGFTITYAHHCIIEGERNGSIYSIFITIVLALVFTVLQGIEYIDSTYTFCDSAYGSSFYISTGFHGLHVIIGTIFIGVGLWRLFNYHFTISHHLGLESSILYWHFVDVVWLFLFVGIYLWGS